MTTSFVIVVSTSVILLIIQAVWHDAQTVRWQRERKELIDRIQAGTLQEFKTLNKEPSAAIVKDRDQKVAEQCSKLGLQRSDFQYPPIWKG